MDSLLFESPFLMNWVGMGLRGLLLAALFGAIVWCLVDRRVRHIAALTWKTAFRLRFVWVMILLLVLVVGGLPAVLRDDGSAKGMAQIILTYTLSMTTGILGFATLWLAVGSMARDIGDCQMQMVATKPIARWQIWLGKWLGIMGLNLMLLGFAGSVVYGMMEYRANQMDEAQYTMLKDRSDGEIVSLSIRSWQQGELRIDQVVQVDDVKKEILTNEQGRYIPRPVEELKRLLASLPRKKLREQVLVSRAPLELEDVLLLYGTNNLGVPYRDWRKGNRKVEEENAIQEVLKIMQQNATAQKQGERITALPPEMQQQIRKDIRLQYAMLSQMVVPKTGRRLVFRKPLGSFDEDRGLVLRFQLEDSRMSFKSDRKYKMSLYYSRDGKEQGPPPQSRLYSARTHIEEPLIAVARMITEGGVTNKISIFGTNDLMYVDLFNEEEPQQGQEYLGVIRLPFVDDRTGELNQRGIEVMYYEGGFLKNYLRALAIVFAWLGVLAALGLAAASFMSFSMAVFACTGILLISFCTGIMKDVVADDTVMQTWTDGQRDASLVDFFAVNSFRIMVSVISPVKDYSPIEDLTDGRAITWGQLARAYSYIWGVSGLLIFAVGTLIFSRRQLAITDSDE
jgi:ABC-type transport system involved in multi-copper enzyme maturation permease subunit